MALMNCSAERWTAVALGDDKENCDFEERRAEAATFLLKLHACLQLKTASGALCWVGDGTRFQVQLASREALASCFGATTTQFRRALEALDFQFQEERESAVLLATHSEFSKWKFPDVDKMSVSSLTRRVIEFDDMLRMPEVSYNPALKPLEVRVRCFGATASCGESWEVVIASSLKPAASSTERDAPYYMLDDDECFGSDRQLFVPTTTVAGSSEDKDSETCSWLDDSSESSSQCFDDLTDIDILSQISAYYG